MTGLWEVPYQPAARAAENGELYTALLEYAAIEAVYRDGVATIGERDTARLRFDVAFGVRVERLRADRRQAKSEATEEG